MPVTFVGFMIVHVAKKPVVISTPNAAGCGHRRQYSVDSVQTVGLCTIVTYLLLSKVRGSVARGVEKQ